MCDMFALFPQSISFAAFPGFLYIFDIKLIVEFPNA